MLIGSLSITDEGTKKYDPGNSWRDNGDIDNHISHVFHCLTAWAGGSIVWLATPGERPVESMAIDGSGVVDVRR